MAASMPRQTGLGIEEVILLVDVEALVVVAALLLVELVVDAVGLVAHMAVLNVGEGVPLVGELCRLPSRRRCRRTFAPEP